MNPARWRFIDGALLIVLCALGVLATRSIWADILGYAMRDGEHSYILIVPGVVAWLVWVRRERLRRCAPRWSILGPLVILGSWGLGVLGYTQSILVAEHLCAVGVLLGAALTVLGPRFFMAFAPAIAATAFLIPVPGMLRQRIAIPLQEASAYITHWILDVFGAPVTQLGNVLSIDGHDVAVAEACNGMRMAAALALVAYAYVFSAPLRTGVRVLIVMLSPFVAILCNVIRLTPSVLLYGYAPQDTADLFHDVSGWAILVVALGMLWLVGALLRWMEVPIEPYAVGGGWTP